MLPLLALAVSAAAGVWQLSRWLFGARSFRKGVLGAWHFPKGSSSAWHRAADGARRLHHLAVGLLPLALSLWIYHVVLRTGRAQVYFVYDAVLLYLSDGVALVAVAAWAARRMLAPQEGALGADTEWSFPLRTVLILLLALAAASVAWSMAPALSFYAAIHLALLFALFLSLRDDGQSWRFVAFGSTVALLLQAGVALAGFLAQSTAFLAPLGLTWPGALTPEISGASVVELADGTRWLRAYGTLPHPNVLGGWLMVLLAAPLTGFLGRGERRWSLLPLVGLGVVALMLSFSRSAWLGLAAGGGVILCHWRRLDLRRLLVVAVVASLAVLMVVLPLRDLFYTRVAGLSVDTEARSIRERRALSDKAVSLIRRRPLLGTGMGAFVPALAQLALEGAPIEPDHNVPRLATAELGLGGGLLTLAAGAMVLNGARKARSVTAVILSAAVVGLMVVALFDHYLWALPAGRTMTALFLGSWAGQVRAEEPTSHRGR